MFRFLFGLLWRLVIASALVIFGLGLCVLPEKKAAKSKKKKNKPSPKTDKNG